MSRSLLSGGGAGSLSCCGSRLSVESQVLGRDDRFVRRHINLEPVERVCGGAFKPGAVDHAHQPAKVSRVKIVRDHHHVARLKGRFAGACFGCFCLAGGKSRLVLVCRFLLALPEILVCAGRHVATPSIQEYSTGMTGSKSDDGDSVEGSGELARPCEQGGGGGSPILGTEGPCDVTHVWRSKGHDKLPFDPGRRHRWRAWGLQRRLRRGRFGP